MKKVIDKNLYFRTIYDILLYAILAIAVSIIILTANNETVLYGEEMYFRISRAFTPIDGALVTAMFVGSIVMSFKAMQFTRDKKQTDYVCSLPYTKAQLFFSKMLAVVTIEFFVLIVTAIIGIIMFSEYLGTIMFFSDTSIALLETFTGSLIIVGAVFISIGLTGRLFTSFIISFLFIAAPASRLLMQVVQSFNGYIAPFIFKRNLYILSNLVSDVKDINETSGYMPAIVFSVVLAIIYIAIGYKLFSARSGEISGIFTKNKFINYISMGVLPSIIFYLFAIQAISYYMLASDISFKEHAIAFLIYFTAAIFSAFLYEAITQRRIRKNNRCIWVVIVCIVLAFAVNGAYSYILESNSKKDIKYENINNLNLLTYGYEHYYKDSNTLSYSSYLVSKIDFVDEQLIEIFANHYNSLYNHSGQIEDVKVVNFNMKWGIKLKRYLYFFDIDNEEGLEKANEILNSNTEYQNARWKMLPNKYITKITNELYDDIYLDESGLEQVYIQLMDEWDELPDETKEQIKLNREYYDYNNDQDALHSFGTLYVKGRVGIKNVIDIYSITNATPLTANLYFQLTNDANRQKYIEVLEYYRNNNNFGKNYITIKFIGKDKKENDKIMSLGLNGKDSADADYSSELYSVLEHCSDDTPNVEELFVEVVFSNAYSAPENDIVYFVSVTQSQLNKIKEIYDFRNNINE